MLLRPLRSARHAGLLATAIGVLAPLAGPGGASAAAVLNCDASALRGTVLTAAGIEPITANRNQPNCKAASAGLNSQTLPLPAPVTAAAVAAITGVGTPTGAGQRAAATGGIADLRVRALPDLPIQLPTGSLPVVAPVPVPLLPGVTITADINAALQALLPNGKLPAVDLLRLGASVASAEAKCVAGNTQLSGSSQVASLNVLGRDFPTDRAVDETLSLIDTASIDPTKINLSSVVLTGLPLGVTANAPQVVTALTNALALLPKVPVIIDPTLARVKVTPSSQVRAGDRLTQQALRVEVSIAGQNVADLLLGEASVTGAGLECAAPPVVTPPAVTQTAGLALQCTTRRLVLTDVLRSGNKVKLTGAADRKFVGKKVGIVFTATGKKVATAIVKKDGTFATSAPLPPKAIRSTNKARYIAKIGSEKSLNLKLVRRLIIKSVKAQDGLVTIKGQVTLPLGKPVQKIVLSRRISCQKNQVVKSFKPAKDGSFTVKVAAPPQQLAAVYRLQTRVRKSAANAKLFPTFTLPRAVLLD